MQLDLLAQRAESQVARLEQALAALRTAATAEAAAHASAIEALRDTHAEELVRLGMVRLIQLSASRDKLRKERAVAAVLQKVKMRAAVTSLRAWQMMVSDKVGMRHKMKKVVARIRNMACATAINAWKGVVSEQKRALTEAGRAAGRELQAELQAELGRVSALRETERAGSERQLQGAETRFKHAEAQAVALDSQVCQLVQVLLDVQTKAAADAETQQSRHGLQVAELEQALADVKTTAAAEAADLAAAFAQDTAQSACRNALRAHEYDEKLSAVRRSAAAAVAAHASGMDGLRAAHSSELERLIAVREAERAASERKLQHTEPQSVRAQAIYPLPVIYGSNLTDFL